MTAESRISVRVLHTIAPVKFRDSWDGRRRFDDGPEPLTMELAIGLVSITNRTTKEVVYVPLSNVACFTAWE